MSVNLLTERHLEFLSLIGSCTGPSESTHVKMPHCWKSHVAAQVCFSYQRISQRVVRTSLSPMGRMASRGMSIPEFIRSGNLQPFVIFQGGIWTLCPPLDPRMDINEITLYLTQEQGSEGIICCLQELSSSS